MNKKIKGRFDNVFDSLKSLIKSFNYLIQENLSFSNTLTFKNINFCLIEVSVGSNLGQEISSFLGYKLPVLILSIQI